MLEQIEEIEKLIKEQVSLLERVQMLSRLQEAEVAAKTLKHLVEAYNLLKKQEF